MELKLILHHDSGQLREFADIPVPVACISASRLSMRRVEKNMKKAAMETAEKRYGPGSTVSYMVSCAYNAAAERYRRARAAYDERVVALLHEYDIDVALLDRWRVIMGPEFLRSYLGAAINTCQAILPDLRGISPVPDAWIRAVLGKNPWTGSTAHFVARGACRGPPIRQMETTKIIQSMEPADVRCENYHLEGHNLWNALIACLYDADFAELLMVRREARHPNGDGETVKKRASKMARALVRKYRAEFDSHWERRKKEGLGTGRYGYIAPFGANSSTRGGIQRTTTPARPARMRGKGMNTAHNPNTN